MLYKVYGMCLSTCSLLNPRIRTRARINGKYARNHFCSERVAFKQKRFDIILRKNLTNCFFDLFSMKFILLLSRRICCFCFCAIFLEIACFQCDCIILIAFNFFKFNLVQAACLFDNHHDTIIFRDFNSFRNVLIFPPKWLYYGNGIFYSCKLYHTAFSSPYTLNRDRCIFGSSQYITGYT